MAKDKEIKKQKGLVNLNKMSADEVREYAISKGFKAEDIEDLNKTQIIEALDDIETEEEENTASKKNEVIDSLKGFKGTEIHVHELRDGVSTYVRTYSEEVHGEDFLDNAESFKSKKATYVFVK